MIPNWPLVSGSSSGVRNVGFRTPPHHSALLGRARSERVYDQQPPPVIASRAVVTVRNYREYQPVLGQGRTLQSRSHHSRPVAVKRTAQRLWRNQGEPAHPLASFNLSASNLFLRDNFCFANPPSLALGLRSR